MSKKPNYKAMATRVLWRLSHIQKPEERQRYLEAALRDLFEGGMVYVAQRLAPTPKSMKKHGLPSPAPDSTWVSVTGFQKSLGNLGATLGDLSNELAGVR